MKIAGQNLNKSGNISDLSKTERPNSSKGTPSSSVDESSARGLASSVAVSPSAVSAQKAKDIASQQTVDEARVARLQKLIDDGEYSVDAARVADKLVDEHLVMAD